MTHGDIPIIAAAPSTWHKASHTRWLKVEAQPRPWARAGTVNGRHYTPTPVKLMQDAWREAWRSSGHEDLDGPLMVLAAIFAYERPKGHWLKNGGLSAAGRNSYLPTRGDIDNLLKLPLDALNGIAYADDVQFTVIKRVEKLWVPTKGDPGFSLLGICEARDYQPR